jgi:hypothetical protein
VVAVCVGADTVCIGASDPGEGIRGKRRAFSLSEMSLVARNYCVLEGFSRVDDFHGSLCDRGAGVWVDVGDLRQNLHFRQRNISCRFKCPGDSPEPFAVDQLAVYNSDCGVDVSRLRRQSPSMTCARPGGT